MNSEIVISVAFGVLLALIAWKHWQKLWEFIGKALLAILAFVAVGIVGFLFFTENLVRWYVIALLVFFGGCQLIFWWDEKRRKPYLEYAKRTRITSLIPKEAFPDLEDFLVYSFLPEAVGGLGIRDRGTYRLTVRIEAEGTSWYIPIAHSEYRPDLLRSANALRDAAFKGILASNVTAITVDRYDDNGETMIGGIDYILLKKDLLKHRATQGWSTSAAVSDEDGGRG